MTRSSWAFGTAAASSTSAQLCSGFQLPVIPALTESGDWRAGERWVTDPSPSCWDALGVDSCQGPLGRWLRGETRCFHEWQVRNGENGPFVLMSRSEVTA